MSCPVLCIYRSPRPACPAHYSSRTNEERGLPNSRVIGGTARLGLCLTNGRIESKKGERVEHPFLPVKVPLAMVTPGWQLKADSIAFFVCLSHVFHAASARLNDIPSFCFTTMAAVLYQPVAAIVI
uniref:Uncharacterized protein n=1 Tax=Panagrellus redivivus TaxID=6233 RepID=A0A7E4W4P7_PANRE